MASSLSHSYSGIVLNQNVPASNADDHVALTSAIYQTFHLPHDFKRGGVRPPALTGLQVFVNVSDAETASLDWTLEQKALFADWEEIGSGTATGAQAEGDEVWFNIIFDPIDTTAITDSQFRFSITADDGIAWAWYADPNPLSATGDKALTTPTTALTDPETAQEVSLLFRVLAATADSGTDFLGDTYRSAVVASTPDHADTSSFDPTVFYLCSPQPSRFAVVSMYFDNRADDGTAQVVDSILLDPLTPSVWVNVYYSDDGEPGTTETEWEERIWSRVPKSFRMDARQTFALPQPVSAKYIQLEFSHLQPKSYNAGTFQKATLYKKHPKWVLDYFLLAITASSTDFIAKNVQVNYDALDLAYSYYKDDLDQTPDAVPVLTQEDQSRLANFIGSQDDVSDQVDAATRQKISLAVAPYTQQPAVQNLGRTLLGQQLLSGTNAAYSTESIANFTTIGVSTRSADRDAVILEQSYPVMYFFVNSRHRYREVMASFTENRAYFVGLREVGLFRERYTQASDKTQYIEPISDLANAERDDFLPVPVPTPLPSNAPVCPNLIVNSSFEQPFSSRWDDFSLVPGGGWDYYTGHNFGNELATFERSAAWTSDGAWSGHFRTGDNIYAPVIFGSGVDAPSPALFTFRSAVPAGTFLSIVVGDGVGYVNTLTGVTDSQGNTYVVDSAVDQADGGGSVYVAHSIITNPLTTADSLSLAFDSGNWPHFSVIAHVFAGVTGISAVGTPHGRFGAGSITASVTPSAGDLIIGYAVYEHGPATNPIAGGWINFINGGGDSENHLLGTYHRVSDGSPVSVTTSTVATDGYGAAVAVAYTTSGPFIGPAEIGNTDVAPINIATWTSLGDLGSGWWPVTAGDPYKFRLDGFGVHESGSTLVGIDYYDSSFALLGSSTASLSFSDGTATPDITATGVAPAGAVWAVPFFRLSSDVEYSEVYIDRTFFGGTVILGTIADRVDPLSGFLDIAPPTYTSTGGHPVKWSATGLPPGMSMDETTGHMTGTSTLHGVFTTIVTATDTVTGCSGSTSFSWEIDPSIFVDNPGPQGTVTPTPGGTADGAVSLQMTATDTAGNPVTWSAIGLPPGTSINPSSGLITGNTTGTSTSMLGDNVTVTATDSVDPTVSGSTTFTWARHPEILPLGQVATTSGIALRHPLITEGDPGFTVPVTAEVPAGTSLILIVCATEAERSYLPFYGFEGRHAVSVSDTRSNTWGLLATTTETAWPPGVFTFNTSFFPLGLDADVEVWATKVTTALHPGDVITLNPHIGGGTISVGPLAFGADAYAFSNIIWWDGTTMSFSEPGFFADPTGLYTPGQSPLSAYRLLPSVDDATFVTSGDNIPVTNIYTSTGFYRLRLGAAFFSHPDSLATNPFSAWRQGTWSTLDEHYFQDWCVTTRLVPNGDFTVGTEGDSPPTSWATALNGQITATGATATTVSQIAPVGASGPAVYGTAGDNRSVHLQTTGVGQGVGVTVPGPFKKDHLYAVSLFVMNGGSDYRLKFGNGADQGFTVPSGYDYFGVGSGPDAVALYWAPTADHASATVSVVSAVATASETYFSAVAMMEGANSNNEMVADAWFDPNAWAEVIGGPPQFWTAAGAATLTIVSDRPPEKTNSSDFNAMQVVTSGSGQGGQHNFVRGHAWEARSGVRYRYFVYMKGSVGGEVVTVDYGALGTDVASQTITLTNAWQVYTGYYVAAADHASIGIKLTTTGAATFRATGFSSEPLDQGTQLALDFVTGYSLDQSFTDDLPANRAGAIWTTSEEGFRMGVFPAVS